MSIEQIERRTKQLAFRKFLTICPFKLTLRDGQRWGPLIPQDVQADAAVRVDVWVVDAGGEVDLRWLEWVVCWEVDGEEEDTAGVWRVALLLSVSIVLVYISILTPIRCHIHPNAYSVPKSRW